MRRKCESALILGLLRSNTANLAIPLIDDALKRSIESCSWDDAIHFYTYNLQTGNCSDVLIPYEHLSHDQIEYLETIELLRICSQMDRNVLLEEITKLKGEIAGSKLASLKCACSLIMRLKSGHSDGFKTFAMTCRKAISDLGDTLVVPGGFAINGPSLGEILGRLLVLAQIRFQLPEVNLKEPSLFDLELQCLQSNMNEKEHRHALSPLQEALWSTGSGSGDCGALNSFASLHPEMSNRFKLWNVQLLLQQDLYEANMALQQLQTEPSFTPDAYSYLIEALVLYKSQKAVHQTKEALLNALKILNASSTRDDVLKLCVMMLLADIYQSTDFNLAEKMAATAHSYSCNLGNSLMALHAGLILERMYALKGDDSAAASQKKLNSSHRNSIIL